MGRFYALLLLAAGCGDNLVDDAPTRLTDVDIGATAVVPPVARLVPEICATNQWTTMTTADPRLDLAVANWPKTTTVIAVPTTGGTMTGFQLDDRFDIVTDPAGTKVLIDDAFSSVAVSAVGSHLLAMAVDATSVQVDLLNPDLTGPVTIAKIPDQLIAKPGFFATDQTHVVLTGGANGVNITQFDNAWQLAGTTLVGATSQVTDLAATQAGDALLATWSTVDGQCYVQQIGIHPGPSAGTTYPCAGVRIAADVMHDSAKLVFEGDGNIRITHIAHTQMGGDSVLLRPDGMSPRIAFDGAHYWVSYIDTRGDIVVGLLDEHNELQSLAISNSTKPHRDAYDLVTVDGATWVFSVDPTMGYVANRLCAVPAAN